MEAYTVGDLNLSLECAICSIELMKKTLMPVSIDRSDPYVVSIKLDALDMVERTRKTESFL